MKKVLLSFVVALMATTVMGETNPIIELPRIKPVNATTLKGENLKGNVLIVKLARYAYKENFGEPQAGNPNHFRAYVYDENGRSIIQRTIGYGVEIDAYSKESVTSYIFDYTQEGEGLAVTALGIHILADNGLTFEPQLMSTDGFENQILSTPDKYISSGASNRHEMKYTKNGILTLYNYYALNGSLEEKVVGKQNPDKTWKYIKYKASGDACEENTRTFNANGQLVKLEYSKFGPNNHPTGGELTSPAEGTYTYDAKGRFVGFQNPREGHNMKYNKVFNDKGDWTNIISTWEQPAPPKTPKKIRKDEQTEYSDYVYDSHGNWIQRVVWHHQRKAQYIEKREIIYCDTKEELKEKSAQMYQATSALIKSKQK